MKRDAALVGGLALAMALVPLTVACSQTESEGPTQILKEFLAREFAGDGEARFDLAYLTASYVVATGHLDDPLEGNGVYWTADPIVVVESYSIGQISAAQDGAMAVAVEFRPLLRSVGSGERERALVPSETDTERITMNVVKKGACWFILNPPPAHVSLDALLKFYEYEVAQTARALSNNPLVSEGQKEFLQKERDAYDFLKNFAASRAATEPR